jgi:DHA2 family multidrug resistance protein
MSASSPEKAQTSEVPRITGRQMLIVLNVTLATAVYAFTWNSVTVALPHMQGAFSSTIDQVAWVMISFVIGSAAMTASVGFLSDRYGRKEVFLISTVGFLVTLVGCASSSTLTEMVFWRFMQGLCGSGLMPLGQIIAVNAFPKERYGQATALWALGFVTANVFSPAISGLIVDSLGWQWIFYVPLPIGIAMLLAAIVLIPRTPKKDRDLNVTGYAALIIGISALQLMLARGERLDWFQSTEVIVEASIGALGLYWFIVNTLTAKQPFFDRELFRNRNFNLGNALVFMVGMVMFLPLLLLPLELQQISGYTAIDTGYLLMSRGAGSVMGLLILSRFRDRVDPRPILFVGLVCTGLACWNMSGWTVNIRAWDVIWTNWLLGIATGAVWAPMNTLTLSKLSDKLQDQGFAFYYLAFDVGSAIGTAAIVGLHARHSQINRAVLTEQITPFIEAGRLGALPDMWSLTDSAGLATLEQEVARQASMIAFNNSFMVIGAVMFSLIPFIFLFRYSRE